MCKGEKLFLIVGMCVWAKDGERDRVKEERVMVGGCAVHESSSCDWEEERRGRKSVSVVSEGRDRWGI